MTEQSDIYGRKMMRRQLQQSGGVESRLQSIPSRRPNARCAVVRPFSGMSNMQTGAGDKIVTLPKEPWEASK